MYVLGQDDVRIANDAQTCEGAEGIPAVGFGVWSLSHSTLERLTCTDQHCLQNQGASLTPANPLWKSCEQGIPFT
jgi:hypothetical protein